MFLFSIFWGACKICWVSFNIILFLSFHLSVHMLAKNIVMGWPIIYIYILALPSVLHTKAYLVWCPHGFSTQGKEYLDTFLQNLSLFPLRFLCVVQRESLYLLKSSTCWSCNPAFYMCGTYCLLFFLMIVFQSLQVYKSCTFNIAFHNFLISALIHDLNFLVT